MSSSARRLRRATLGLSGLWALSWLLAATSLDRDIVIVPFYVDAAASPEDYPRVRAFPSWTRAAVQPGTPLALGDAVVAIGGRPMRGAGTARVVSHAWAAMGNDGVLEVRVLRAGQPLSTRVAIPASISKWPVVVVSAVFGASALFALSRLRHLHLAQLAALPMMVTALWLGAYFGRTAPEMLAGFWLRAGALSLLLPAHLFFFRHFPDADDRRVAWARGWPALLAVQGLFFVDTEMFQRLPAALSDLGPKLLTGVAAALSLGVGTLNYRSSSPSGRRRFKWLLLGIYVALLPPTLVSLLSAVRPELGAYFLPSQLSLLAIPLSIGIGLGRADLLDIDQLLNATTVYLGFAALLLVALTLGVPVWSGWAAREAEFSPQTATTLLTAGLLGLALPAAVALRLRLDAWVLADRRALEGEVAALQLAIDADDKLEELATRLADRLPAIWKADGAGVYADAGWVFAPVAASPSHRMGGELPGSGEPSALHTLPPARRRSPPGSCTASGIARSGSSIPTGRGGRPAVPCCGAGSWWSSRSRRPSRRSPSQTASDPMRSSWTAGRRAPAVRPGSTSSLRAGPTRFPPACCAVALPFRGATSAGLAPCPCRCSTSPSSRSVSGRCSRICFGAGASRLALKRSPPVSLWSGCSLPRPRSKHPHPEAARAVCAAPRRARATPRARGCGAAGPRWVG